MSSPPTSAVTISLDRVSPSAAASGLLHPSSSTTTSLGHLSPFLLHPLPLIQSKDKRFFKWPLHFTWLNFESLEEIL
ncbi:hypothetical protein QYF36_004109 [Acer negundo]|nr:hypothetical protein QYF36_004109 [Acer negundo]